MAITSNQHTDSTIKNHWSCKSPMAGSIKPIYGAAFAHGSPGSFRPSDLAQRKDRRMNTSNSPSHSTSRATSPSRNEENQPNINSNLPMTQAVDSKEDTRNKVADMSAIVVTKHESPQKFDFISKRETEEVSFSTNKNVIDISKSTKLDDSKAAAEILKLNNRIAKTEKFRKALTQSNVDLAALRKLAWSGTPEEFRPCTWQHLMGYLPCNSERRQSTLDRKRAEYNEMVKSAFGNDFSRIDKAIYHQIHIDIPRTNPNMPIYQNELIQKSLERILYCWAIRHPASGYVQGINDLVTPFFQVFISAYLNKDLDKLDIESISSEIFAIVEADSFWCLSKLLDGIQDSYTDQQPGIVRQVSKLAELIARIDAPLSAHFQAQSVEFYQFAFRWMNCLLMRELSLKSVIRMWDTYMAEGPDGFAHFHVYVCAAFLVKWSCELQKMEFPDIMMFLQSIPKKTSDWNEREMEILLSEAFMWKSLFDTTKHLSSETAAFVPIK